MTEVVPKIHIIPERRTASYSVPIFPGKGHDLVGEVKAKEVRLVGPMPNGYGRSRAVISLPKTQEALEMLQELIVALRNELTTQGIERAPLEVSE